MEQATNPLARLLEEHQLILRMVALMRDHIDILDATSTASVEFVDTVADFMKTYADRCHHGKEALLGRSLKMKDLKPEHREVIRELDEEHVAGLQNVNHLLKAVRKYAGGDTRALPELRRCMKDISELYPVHAEKEEEKLYPHAMGYFSEDERAALFAEFCEHERRVLFEHYSWVVEDWETRESVK